MRHIHSSQIDNSHHVVNLSEIICCAKDEVGTKLRFCEKCHSIVNGKEKCCVNCYNRTIEMPKTLLQQVAFLEERLQDLMAYRVILHKEPSKFLEIKTVTESGY